MNTIARLPADRAPRMIDLTRSLPDLRGSLSPQSSSIQDRASSLQDAEAFSWQAVGLTLGWIAGSALLLAALAFLTLRQ
jgi:hypothetical protein